MLIVSCLTTCSKEIKAVVQSPDSFWGERCCGVFTPSPCVLEPHDSIFAELP